jgi:hypothetical protein
MQLRGQVKQTTSLEKRLAAQALRLREKAKVLPPGIERERANREAREAETGSYINECLRSPDLRAPT